MSRGLGEEGGLEVLEHCEDVSFPHLMAGAESKRPIQSADVDSLGWDFYPSALLASCRFRCSCEQRSVIDSSSPQKTCRAFELPK